MQSTTNTSDGGAEVTKESATGHVLDQARRLVAGLQGLKHLSTDVSPERASYFLLFALLHGGPARATDLARRQHSDLSNVSRRAAELVGAGLVRRVADQEDGRASLLELTKAGRAKCDELVEARNRVFAATFTDWDREDLEQLARLLGHFNDSLDQNRDHIVAAICSGTEEKERQ